MKQHAGVGAARMVEAGLLFLRPRRTATSE
jgi:hypothetical protein